MHLPPADASISGPFPPAALVDGQNMSRLGLSFVEVDSFHYIYLPEVSNQSYKDNRSWADNSYKVNPSRVTFDTPVPINQCTKP